MKIIESIKKDFNTMRIPSGNWNSKRSRIKVPAGYSANSWSWIMLLNAPETMMSRKCFGRSKAVTRTVSRWRTPKCRASHHFVAHADKPACGASDSTLLRAAGGVLMYVNAAGEVKDSFSWGANDS